MLFARKHHEYGCPMCGRLPVIKALQTDKYNESRKVKTLLTVYRLGCPRGHIATSWFSHTALASRQWKGLVDEYNGKGDEMSMRTSTTYRHECDYPGCHICYDYCDTSDEAATEDIIDDEEWLCLFASDNRPRFFCPMHMRYDTYWPGIRSTVFYDSDSPDTQTSLPDLNKYYEDMGASQPLPKPECASSILAALAD